MIWYPKLDCSLQIQYIVPEHVSDGMGLSIINSVEFTPKVAVINTQSSCDADLANALNLAMKRGPRAPTLHERSFINPLQSIVQSTRYAANHVPRLKRSITPHSIALFDAQQSFLPRQHAAPRSFPTTLLDNRLPGRQAIDQYQLDGGLDRTLSFPPHAQHPT